MNENQLLILSRIKGDYEITYFLRLIYESNRVPLSTLRLNAKILRNLGLIEYGITPVKITPTGSLVLKILNGG